MAAALNKFNAELLKKLFDSRPLVLLKHYSQEPEDIFKRYSDEPAASDRYRVLDEQDYQRFISKRAQLREPALTRTMTTLAYKIGKQMISLAEGMPNEAVFPFSSVDITTKAGEKLHIEGEELATALQYVPSQGLPILLSELRDYQQHVHRPPPLPRDVLVTCGGQHGIYHCIEMLVDPGDPVITAQYTYTGTLIALKPYKSEILGIPEDENGMIPERLAAVLDERLAKGLKMPKMMYIVPTGNNPTGTVTSEERRRTLYEMACRYDFLIVEDDPYMFLTYHERPPATFLSLDTCGRVLRLDSISKVVSAGLRGGWMTAPAPLVRTAELLAQAELLHPCTLSQTILWRLLARRSELATLMRQARDLYNRRRVALGEALRGSPELAELVEWQEPKGGLFYWVRVHALPDIYNMVFRTAFDQGLMLVPGQAFCSDTSRPCQHLRLTFSRIKTPDMAVAAQHLATAISRERQAQRGPDRLAVERNKSGKANKRKMKGEKRRNYDSSRFKEAYMKVA